MGNIFKIITVAILILATLFLTSNGASPRQDYFNIQRGTNISHWLSQSGRRGAERREWFTKNDVEFLAGLGFDHLRIPIDEEQMWDKEGNKEGEAFNLCNNVLDWCSEYILRVIVDLRI